MKELINTGSLSLLAFAAPVLPLISFLGILFFYKRGKGSALALFNIFVSFIISLFIFCFIWDKQPVQQQVEWFKIGQYTFTAGILLNNLSVLMLVLISGISFLVHIYSLQYMKNDEYLNRYWAYLGLFCFSMLGLVIADNLLIVYMFWELVGFSSYLLIGFWFTREAAVLANKKAFIINRIGDLGFLTGIMILFSQFHTLDIGVLFSENGLINQSIIKHGLWITEASQLPEIWLTIAGGALVFGAIAKSAQFPLHTWLPDAMEGPTSVSSLIHAATMVAAGIFLIARVYPLFDTTVLNGIAIIGSFTAFMAATIASVQNDIKKILAFSTISQIGFMMLAMGVGAYGAGIFHLTTHAFFKCLLFLAAGSIIHQLHHLKEQNKLDFDIQDIRNMGGLKKYMPLTFFTILMAAIALIGLPFTSGYLSKDAVLIQTFEWGNTQNSLLQVIPYVALITSWLTAFYISRLIFKVFFGDFNLKKKFSFESGLHESPKQMIIPMIVLGMFCLFPVFSSNPFNYENSWLIKGLPPPNGSVNENLHLIIPVLVNAIAIGILFYTYFKYNKQQNIYSANEGIIHKFLLNQWHFNVIYRGLFVNPIAVISNKAYYFDRVIVDGFVDLLAKSGRVLSVISAYTDRYIIDGLVNATGGFAKRLGNFTRHFQTGRLQHYLVTMLLVVIAFFMVKYFFS